jgi:hypothetical protein
MAENPMPEKTSDQLRFRRSEQVQKSSAQTEAGSVGDQSERFQTGSSNQRAAAGRRPLFRNEPT